MQWHSCYINDSDRWERECNVERNVNPETGELVGIRYSTLLARNAMPDPYAEMRIEQIQESLARITLHYEVADPENPDVLIIGSGSDYVGYRQADSNYEEECRFANKDC